MSYQRWGKPGRFYIWASETDLHIWVSREIKMWFTKDPAGRDNAEAAIVGLVDHLRDMKVSVEVRPGKAPKFTKLAKQKP